MPIAPADLIAPAGRLDPAVLWPGEAAAATTVRLQAYINSANVANVAAENVDSATTAWAYFRAYESVYQTMLATPASGDFADAGSYAITANQITGIKERMDYWSSVYQGYVPPPDNPAASGAPQPSVSAPITFTW